MSNIQCPLCQSKKIEIIETIRRKELIFLYKKMTGVDFSYLIPQDIDFCECENCKLRFYNPLITGDEEFYNSLQKFDWYYMNEKEEYIYAKSYIKDTDKVLEVGCGKGAFAKYLPTNDYVGLDLSKKAKEMAAKDGIKIENYDIKNYAEKHPGEFDVVVSFQVLEHVKDPKEFIELKLKALKKGGRLIIGVPNEESFLRYAFNFVLNMPPHHVTRWRAETFKYIAKQYNLKIDSIYYEKLSNVHKLWYLNTLVVNALLPFKLVNTSITYRILNKFFNLFAKFLLRGFKDEMLPHGHTMVVVFKKL